MREKTEGIVLMETAIGISLLRVLEEKQILKREDSQRLFDYAGLWLSELNPDLTSPSAKEYAQKIVDGMAQALTGHEAKDGPGKPPPKAQKK